MRKSLWIALIIIIITIGWCDIPNFVEKTFMNDVQNFKNCESSIGLTPRHSHVFASENIGKA